MEKRTKENVKKDRRYYKRTERLQFEDDEYYYYVKAVPKIKDMKKSSGRKPEEVPVDSAVIRNRERE